MMSTMVQAALFDMPSAPVPMLRNARVTSSESRHILSPGRGMLSSYDYSLNAYRGCTFGCSYCYAASFVSDEDMRREWGEWVEIKRNAVEVLRSRPLTNRSIYMSSATDPYQPIEVQTGLTRRIVEELLKAQARLVIQTRSPLVTRDIDLLKQFKNVRVNMSITTDDDDTRKAFEPGCPSIKRRLDTVRKLKTAGIKTTICLVPLLPVTNPVAFARELRLIGPNHVATGFFHHTDRAFASDTRDPAWELARQRGWDRAAYDETKRVLIRELSNLTSNGDGFAPV